MAEEFGNISTNVDALSGSYTSVEWKARSSKNEIRLYLPTQGNPLLEEKENRNYSFVCKTENRKVSRR